MTKQRLPPDDLREWLNRARSNPALASQRVPGVYLVSLKTLAENGAKSGSALAQAPLVAHDAVKSAQAALGVRIGRELVWPYGDGRAAEKIVAEVMCNTT